MYRKVLRWWLSKNSCDIFKDFSSTSCIYKLCVLQRVATQYFIKIRTFCNKIFSKCIFLDLRKTSASSRRPVFANPRLRRDLNLRKIDQSKSNGLNSPLWVNLWIFKLNDQLSFLSQMEKLNSLFTFVNCFMDFQTNGPLDCLSHSKQLNGVWDH